MVDRLIPKSRQTKDTFRKHGVVYLIQHLSSGRYYVGQTVRTILGRISSHLIARTKIGAAFRKYGRNAFSVSEIFVAFDQVELDRAEQQLIKVFDALTPAGFNLKEGGDGGHLAEEVKRKIARAHLGKLKPPLSEEHKEKLRIIGTGRIMSPEAIEKSASKRRGQIRSQETCQNISKAKCGKKLRPLSEDHKAKISASHKRLMAAGLRPSCIGGMGGWNKGVPHSEEHKDKIRQAALQYRHSFETLQKMRGQKRTQETKDRIQIALLAFWAKRRIDQNRAA